MPKIENRYLEILARLGGYYACPKNDAGHRLGPLVGYAGKYPGSDGTEKQWVGDVYANFVKVEEDPEALYEYAISMRERLGTILDSIDIFCGAPIGGYSFAGMLAMSCEKRVIKAEKKITALATTGLREQSELVFARHGIEKGRRYAIVEDVCNNFSTTEKLIALIVAQGGKVAAIACMLNRSLNIVGIYPSRVAGSEIPVVSVVQLPIPEYKQDDPAVIDDIIKNNVVWKPKDEWDRLVKATSRTRVPGWRGL